VIDPTAWATVNHIDLVDLTVQIGRKGGHGTISAAGRPIAVDFGERAYGQLLGLDAVDLGFGRFGLRRSAGNNAHTEDHHDHNGHQDHDQDDTGLILQLPEHASIPSRFPARSGFGIADKFAKHFCGNQKKRNNNKDIVERIERR
jgi:hypothetical protein